ncbi:MAG: hypothetical protein ACYS6W_13925 [Planctomycetota bacterium]|jgi:hypothetical protein
MKMPTVDTHKWANKMEILRLVSSKPEVEIKDRFMSSLWDAVGGANGVEVTGAGREEQDPKGKKEVLKRADTLKVV